MEDKNIPDIKPGMKVRVWSKIKEGDKWRSIPFEGIVIARKHGKTAGATFTVRKIGADDIGIERIWPLHSPLIEKIEVLSKSKVRRAKLYYLRERSRRETREKLKSASNG
jgi:large subunit ribosomal protein L19